MLARAATRASQVETLRGPPGTRSSAFSRGIKVADDRSGTNTSRHHTSWLLSLAFAQVRILELCDVAARGASGNHTT